MKLYIKSIIAMATLLLTTSAVAAETDEKFVISYQSDGVDCNEGVAGTVVGSVSGTTATLTVTPVDGYYITKDQILVTKLVSGNNAQTRTTGVDTPVEITATNASADPSGVTTYTFDASDANYRYEVKANFLSRKNIADAQILLPEDLNVVFSGDANEPAISVTYDDEALTADKDYTVEYANNINAGTADITITGKGVYNGTNTTNFDIHKATPEVTAPTAKENLTYTGEAQELINAGSTTGGEMQYSLDNDNETYSTSIPTGTEAKEYTVYYKVVGGTNYEDVAAASIKVTISGAPVESYPLWINDTQVTANNAEDILGHDNNPEKIPLYIYNKKDAILLVNQDSLGTTVIKSGLPELQIYLIEANKIKSIEFYNQGEEGNTGKLTFTCNGNHPGRLVIKNTKGNSVITGFSAIDYKWKLTLTKPESAFYDETAHQMMYKDQNNVTQIADSVIIGQEIIPTYNQEKVSLRNPAFKIAAINFKNYSYSPTGDPTKSKILITLNPTPGDPEAGDDYVDDDGEPGIVVGSTMKDSQAGKVANLVANNELVPGGNKFAEDYDGFTFMVPAGSGTIIIDQEVDAGYEFHLRIGTGAPVTLVEGLPGRAMAQEGYSVTTPTYCYLYLVEKTGAAGTRGTRLGKRTKAHGKLISVQVRATTVIPTTPPSEASDGVIPKSEDPEDPVDPVTPPTGIREVKSEAVKSEKFANRWFTLDGQALQSKPTKAGVYIYNRKKIVIK